MKFFSPSVHRNIVAQCLNGFFLVERLVDGLGLLQADDVGAFVRCSQAVRGRSIRCLTELTFQVATLMGIAARLRARGHRLEQTANAPVKDAAKSPTKLTRLKPAAGH